MINYESLLNPEQKRAVVETRLWEEGAPLDSRVRVLYDRRYSWDFAVVTDVETGVVTVTFSVDVTSRRFRKVILECVKAVEEVVGGRRREVFRGEPFKREN